LIFLFLTAASLLERVTKTLLQHYRIVTKKITQFEGHSSTTDHPSDPLGKTKPPDKLIYRVAPE